MLRIACQVKNLECLYFPKTKGKRRPVDSGRGYKYGSWQEVYRPVDVTDRVVCVHTVPEEPGMKECLVMVQNSCF